MAAERRSKRGDGSSGERWSVEIPRPEGRREPAGEAGEEPAAPDEESPQEEVAIPQERAAPEEEAAALEEETPPEDPAGEDREPEDRDEAGEIPAGRMKRTARIGRTLGTQATRYAGTRAANVARSEEKAGERLESRHAETALKMANLLGEMKGAAMKIGQMASFIDIDFVPEEYRDVYQEQLAKLRSNAPAMPWEKVRGVLEEEYDGRPVDQIFSSFDREAFAAASIGQVHRATLRDGTEVAVKVQYPGVAEALESDLANAGLIVRLGKAIAPGLDAKAVTSELRERVLEELDYEYEAQNQRSFARAYDGHPFIFVPKVHSRLSRRRVLVTDFVKGHGFDHVRELDQEERDIFGEIVFRFCFGSIYNLRHFNADTHPGNYILMEDGRVAFLDFGMTKKVSDDQILLEQRAVDAASRDDAEGLRRSLDDLGFLHKPSKVDAERLLQHVKFVGGWYIEDRFIRLSPKWVLKMVEVTSDPRSEFFDLVRRENLPADELMGRRMETGLLAVLAQIGAGANWHRIMREWLYGDSPSTVLGEAEWRFFERRGVRGAPGLRD